MNPVPLGIYHHYKGNHYEVIGFARHSETLEDMVIYKALYGEGGTWVRPLSMWDNLIEVDGKTVKRFEYVAEHIREITPPDYPFLEEFLYHAIFIPPGSEAPPREIINEPDVFIYIDGFGSKPGDCGVVTEADGKIMGAAWTRIIPAYGHIDDDTPELAISVLPEYRSRGIGAALMARLFVLLRERGYAQISLAVQKKNGAVRFYQRLGYEVVRENDAEFIMIKRLED